MLVRVEPVADLNLKLEGSINKMLGNGPGAYLPYTIFRLDNNLTFQKCSFLGTTCSYPLMIHIWLKSYKLCSRLHNV